MSDVAPLQSARIVDDTSSEGPRPLRAELRELALLGGPITLSFVANQMLGFVDTAKVFGPASYGGSSPYKGFANQFAAMPSLHFGWALVIAWAVLIATTSRWRYLVILHPVITLAAIVLTANHYWLDAAAGLLVAICSAVIASRVLAPVRPAQWAFRPVPEEATA